LVDLAETTLSFLESSGIKPKVLFTPIQHRTQWLLHEAPR